MWGHKIFGLQHSILAKRFYAIRFLHVAEGFDDLALRGQRIECVIKGVRKRSKTCKKVPFNTDLLKRIHTELSVNKQAKKDKDIAQFWAGLLAAFFFCLRISELLAIQYRDVKFTRDHGGWITSILIGESKTDQEKAGVTRMLRNTGMQLFPVTAMRILLNDPTLSKSETCIPPSSFRSKLVHATQWSAGESGIPISVVNTHSLRAGGATALFSAGVDWVAIHR